MLGGVMGIKDFFNNAIDAVTDTARNTRDAIKYNSVVEYAVQVAKEKAFDAEMKTVESIDKASVIVEKAGDDPAVLLHSAKYLLTGALVGTVTPTLINQYLAAQYVANGLNDLSMRVNPIPGSIVYCNLLLTTEHSGIYIGNNKIVHLNRHGSIEIVSPQEFISGTPANAIYVSCNNGKPVGSKLVAERARNFVGHRRDYDVLFDNCHQFSASCLVGDTDNRLTLLTMLKLQSDITLDAKQWLHWDRRNW